MIYTFMFIGMTKFYYITDALTQTSYYENARYVNFRCSAMKQRIVSYLRTEIKI